MLKSKILAIGLSVVVAAGLLAGCGKTQDTSNNSSKGNPKEYQDGIYFAQEDGFGETGWKYVVTLEVKAGKIVKADWNGANKKGGADKKTVSKNGEYGMVAKGNAKSEWHEQAQLAEAYLIEKQDPTAIQYKDDKGNTDAISGATIKVKSFFDLAKKALDKGPVGAGQYKDGTYHAEEKAFAEKSGWKYTVDITVINGYIVAADWNGVHKDGGDDKDTQSKNGQYGMVEKGGAKAEWHEQAEKVEAYLLEKQDPAAIQYKDDKGNTDAISGATINVKGFFDLAQEALAGAKK